MRFDFTAKDEARRRDIAVQQIQFYGISRQKALFHEYGEHCATLLFYRDSDEALINLTEDQIFLYLPSLTDGLSLTRPQFDAFVGFCEVWAIEQCVKFELEEECDET